MIAVSSDYTTAVKAAARRWIPRVVITWTDPYIDPTIAVDSTDKNRVSWPAQTANLKTNPDYKWAHLDGVMTPNSTYHPAPDSAVGAEMGWWNAVRCDGSAEWSAPYPTLVTTFAERAILSLAVSGDSIYNEYPVDFDIEIYDDGDVLLHTEVVTGNTLLNWAGDISDEGINDAVKMQLVIKKWSAPNRVAKILEFYTSIIDTYEGDDIVSMNLLEEREIADGSLPVGNISANELDLELQNIRLTKNGVDIIDPFSYENSDSYLENLLKKNRRIEAWVGLELPDESIEWIPLGTFWSGDWDAAEMSGVVSTSGRDRMELLRKAIYDKSEIEADTTLYDMAVALLESAIDNIPMPDLVYEIDEELLDFPVAVGYFPRQDYFKCLKEIAVACMGQAYMTRDDVLKITGPSFVGNP